MSNQRAQNTKRRGLNIQSSTIPSAVIIPESAQNERGDLIRDCMKVTSISSLDKAILKTFSYLPVGIRAALLKDFENHNKALQGPTCTTAHNVVEVLKNSPQLQAYVAEHNGGNDWNILYAILEPDNIKSLSLSVNSTNYIVIEYLLEKRQHTLLDLHITFGDELSYQPRTNKVDSTVLKAVGKCYKLQSLKLSGIFFCPTTILESISEGCRFLQKLDIQHIKSFTKLRLACLLNRNYNTILSLDLLLTSKDETLLTVAQYCPNLEKLSVVKPVPSGNIHMTQADLKALMSMSSLKELSIRRLEDGNTNGLLDLFQSNTLNNLTKLDISESRDLTDNLLIAICKRCCKLVSLEIQHCTEITTAGFKYIHLLNDLEYLNAVGCNGVTADAIPYIAKCKNLSKIEPLFF